MITINRHPSRRDLLVFGALLALFTAALGSLLHYYHGLSEAARVVWLLGSVLTTIHFLIPPLRRPIYLGWMGAVYPIGWIVSHLLLALVFYFLLTPIGLLSRLLGRSSIDKRGQADSVSFWEKRPAGPPAERYFRQY